MPAIPSPVNARWIDFDPACQVRTLPRNVASAEPLDAIGLKLGGVDLLERRFLAGSACCSSHLLWCVVHGRIRCGYRCGERTLGGGHFVICGAGTPHWIRLASHKAKGLWFHFHDLPRWRLLRTLEAHTGAYPEIQQLESAVDACIAEGKRTDSQARGLCRHYAEIVALQLLRFLERETSGAGQFPPERLSALWERVASGPSETWDIRRLAAAAGLSPSRLHALCVRYYGCPPMTRVAQLRMQHAADLLLRSPLGLEEVAARVGYGSAFSFSHAFKKHMGARPGAWRRSG